MVPSPFRLVVVLVTLVLAGCDSIFETPATPRVSFGVYDTSGLTAGDTGDTAPDTGQDTGDDTGGDTGQDTGDDTGADTGADTGQDTGIHGSTG